MVLAIYVCHWPDAAAAFLRCELLLHRSYHNDAPAAPPAVARFLALFRRAHPKTPFLCAHGVLYISLWGANDVVLVAVARHNVNAMLAVELLSRLLSLMGRYFALGALGSLRGLRALHGPVLGPETALDALRAVTRERIIDNHALVYELLDECVDMGVVQVTDYSILKEYIKMEFHGADAALDSDSDAERPPGSAKTPSKRRRLKTVTATHNRADKLDVAAAQDVVNSSIVRTQVSAISWRPKGIFYAKNEIYIDLAELCEFLYDLELREIRTNRVSGTCSVRLYLLGMPVCKLGLNEQYISQVEHDEEAPEETEAPEATEANGEGRLDHTQIEHEAAAPHHKVPSPEDLPGNQLPALQDDSDEEDEPQNGRNGTPQQSEPQVEQQSLLPNGLQEPQPAGSRLMKVPITNVRFHLCIELSKIYEENLIFFTPPDDEFELFSYSVEQQRRRAKKPLLMVDPTYRVLVKERKLQVMVSLSTHFKKKLHSHKTVVKLPVSASLFPLDSSATDSFRFKCEMGEVRFAVDSSEIVWAIGDLPGSKKVVRMMAEVSLSPTTITPEIIARELHHQPRHYEPQTEDPAAELDRYYGVAGASSSAFATLQKNAAAANDVSVFFEIPMLTYSGLRITYLRVDEDTMKYTCFPWVRYATRTEVARGTQTDTTLGTYRFRLGPSSFTVV